jgi:hypothetical protein
MKVGQISHEKAPDFILGSFMNVYKVGSGATNTLGNWTA